MAFFLLLMLCFTFISRVADTLTTPVVTTEGPRRSAVAQKFTASGNVEAEGGIPVMAPANLPVTALHVALGDRVEAGDLLFTCDTTDLRAGIAAKQLDIQGLQVELNAIAQNEASAEAREQRDLARAQEDYITLEEDVSLAIGEAMTRLKAAKRAYEDYEDEPPGDYSEAELRQLKNAYLAEQIVYDRVVLTQDEALKKARRAIEDMLEKSVDTEAALKQISLQKQQQELAELQKNLAAGGQVYAPAAGTVTTLRVSAGSRTGSDAAAILSDADDLRLTAEITGDQKKYVRVGDPVEFQPYGEQRPIRGLSVLSVVPAADKSDTYLTTLSLPENATAPGLGGQITFSQNSGVKELCVPLSALYMNGDQYYVLVVRETETTLGTRYVAEQVDVTLDELGTDTAAVSGALIQTDKIITGSDRPISAGDRVRLS